MRPLLNLLAVLIGFVFLSLLPACSAPSPNVQLPPVQEAKVKAVLINADWCASCKVLEPKLAIIRPEYEGRGVVFSELDFTSKDEDALFLQAAQQSVEIAMRAHLTSPIKTGQTIIVPLSGDEVLDVVNMNHTPNEIREKLNAAIARQTQ